MNPHEQPFAPLQKEALKEPLDPRHVSSRTQSGRTLSYIEAWWAISEANRIFGFDGWTRETVDMRLVSERERRIGSGGDQGWSVTYVAKVRVISGGVVREGTGAGHGIDRDLGQAHESAAKEAESDAMKRALMTYGNPLGLALYDKTRANVGTVQSQSPSNQSAPPSTRKSAAQAKKDGDHETIKGMLESASTLEDLDARWQVVQDEWLPILPERWADPINDTYMNARDALKAKGA